MKKYIVWMVSLIMAVSMTACSKTEKSDQKDQTQSTKQEQQLVTEKTTSQKDKTTEKKKDKKTKKDKAQKDKTTVTKQSKTTKTKKTTTEKSTTKTSKKEATTRSKKTTMTHVNKVTNEEHQTTQEAKKEETCEFLISCKTVLSHKDSLQSNYQVPSGGKIFEKKMKIEDGDTVMDVLKRTGVELDISKGYVAGIDGLYEFDCGKSSGWMYRVNGKFPNVMAGKCKLKDGDKVEWLYTCVRGDL